jgi:hypothetical protein
MASQQGNVDWFRFWLVGEEDPDPTKAKTVCALARAEEDAGRQLQESEGCRGELSLAGGREAT